MFTAAITAALALSGCTKDLAEPGRTSGGEGEPVSIVLSAFSVGDMAGEAASRGPVTAGSMGDERDSEFTSLRVMIFRTGGTLAYNKTVTISPTFNPFTIEMTTGTYDFVFIANEDTDTDLTARLAAYNAGRKIGDIYHETISSAAFRNDYTIPMTHIIKNVTVTANSSGVGSVAVAGSTKPNPWPVEVTRAAVRVDVILKTDDATVAAAGRFTALQLTNVPNKVYLFDSDGDSGTNYNAGGTGWSEPTSPLAAWREISGTDGDIYTHYDDPPGDDPTILYTLTEDAAARGFVESATETGVYYWYKRIILPSSLFSPVTTEANAITLSAIVNGRPLSATLGKADLKDAAGATIGYTAPRNQRYTMIGTLVPDQPIDFTVSVTPWGGNTDVELPFKLPEIPGAGDALSGNTYVGAFWKADHKGERLIRIAPTAGEGTWAVQVYEYGAGFSRGDILFAAWDGDIAGLTQPADADTDTDALTNGRTSIADGTTDAEGYINFRIGLKDPYTASKTSPARYAVAVIKYTPTNGTPIYQKLFLRQGEGADYLMRPQDGSDNNTVSSRPLAAPYSPYNLTAAAYRSDASPQSSDTGVEVGAGSGAFTEYPTQAGAFWYFSPKSGTSQVDISGAPYIYAMSPTTPNNSGGDNTSKPTGFTHYYDAKYWGENTSLTNYSGQKLAELYEACPPGYRRPTDGSDTNMATTSPTPANSEMGQSVWLNPTSGTTNITAASGNLNAAWGYYADGFFDRRTLATQPAFSNAQSDAAVDIGTPTVAYRGMLFYNPATSGSIFFPAPGYRATDGSLNNTGYYGYYWSSSSQTTGYGWPLYFDSNTTNRSSYVRYAGFSIRCVADEKWTPTTPGKGGNFAITYEPVLNSILVAENTIHITVESDIAWTAEVNRTTDAVTQGALSALGKPLLDPATGFAVGPLDAVLFTGGPTDAVLSGSGDAGISLKPINYKAQNLDGTGTFEIVFRNKATGEVLDVATITTVQTPDATATTAAYDYVGAFWRADQTGERIIRLKPFGLTLAQPLTVEVTDRGDFAEGDIVFSWMPSGDGNVDFATAKTPGEAEGYGVNTNLTRLYTLVRGSSTGSIMFRIGLRSKWTPTAAKPARYAVVTVTFGTGTPLKLYLRQGHDADYVMKTGEAGMISAAGRPAVARFSPYNLTTSNTSALTASPYFDATVAAKSGTMTDYPTKAGAFWQFASTNARYAYSPVATTIAGGGAGSTTWNTTTSTAWSDDQETCPAGWRRPAGAYNTAAGNEFYQSLIATENVLTNAANTNSAYGYYADGYFDRRAIVNGVGTNGGSNTAVDASNVAAGYAGRVFYNPTSAASVFFPATGLRNGDAPSTLEYTGTYAAYWSSTSYDTNAASAMLLSSDEATPAAYTTFRSAGFSVRCVKDETAVLVPALSTTAAGASIMGDGAAKAFTVTSNVAWTATIQSGTNAVTAGDMAGKGYPLLVAASGFNGSAVTATISGGAGTSALNLTPVDYMTLGQTATGSVTIVFRNAATGAVLETAIVAVTQPIAMRFAKSNIVMYTNGTTKVLTFAETEADHTTNKTAGGVSVPAIPSNVQGLHFRWGSLVGLSSSTDDPPLPATTFDGTKDIVFWPQEYEATCKANNGGLTPDAVTWKHNNTAAQWQDATQVPYLGDGNETPLEDRYVGTGYDAAAGYGDICRYVSAQIGWVQGDWRMPTYSELQALLTETPIDGGIRYGTPAGNVNWDYLAMTNPNPANHYGFTAVGNARMVGYGITAADAGNNDYLTGGGSARVILPGAGYRYPSNGAQGSPGYLGNYWSSTPGSDANGSNMVVNGTSITVNTGYGRGNGFSVRCIRE